MKTKTNIDRDPRIKKAHSERHCDFICNGFRFFIVSDDIDFYTAVCVKPYTKENWQKAIALKEKYECDFAHDERDCSGSKSIRVRVGRHRYNKLYRMHNVIVIVYHCSIDV